jgi:hypothetical protein
MWCDRAVAYTKDLPADEWEQLARQGKLKPAQNPVAGNVLV